MVETQRLRAEPLLRVEAPILGGADHGERATSWFGADGRLAPEVSGAGRQLPRAQRPAHHLTSAPYSAIGRAPLALGIRSLITERADHGA